VLLACADTCIVGIMRACGAVWYGVCCISQSAVMFACVSGNEWSDLPTVLSVSPSCTICCPLRALCGDSSLSRCHVWTCFPPDSCNAAWVFSRAQRLSCCCHYEGPPWGFWSLPLGFGRVARACSRQSDTATGRRAASPPIITAFLHPVYPLLVLVHCCSLPPVASDAG
jgi:hypothetical protein